MFLCLCFLICNVDIIMKRLNHSNNVST
ncbi:unnamed protein product [Nyctereutes procyonoides]|uniref:(raccoon dog) hypothetical protein n=1 Tax=Nyctereutes procyonoides TaxID=34880 RepID=A0A811Z7W5_NYCPR|nr:unnamed protein product [Nyctereutes procyonoides]